jgi:hypothetical protein
MFICVCQKIGKTSGLDGVFHIVYLYLGTNCMKEIFCISSTFIKITSEDNQLCRRVVGVFCIKVQPRVAPGARYCVDTPSSITQWRRVSMAHVRRGGPIRGELIGHYDRQTL